MIVNPGGRKETYQGLSSDLTAIEPPIWAGLITTFLLKRNRMVDLLDSNALGLSDSETAKNISDKNPKAVAIIIYGHNPSASTQTMPAARALIEELKKISYPGEIILVGGHVASLPRKSLTEEQVQFICTGEGPHTLDDFIKYLNGEIKVNEVRGICTKYNNQIIQTPAAPLVVNLDDEMPALPWHLLPMHKYRSHNWHAFGLESRSPYASIYTTLGCPYKCSFCCIQAPFKEGEELKGLKKTVNTYRKWSAKSVLSQIDTLVKEYNVKNIKFADEIFVLDRNHVSEICNGLIERDYNLNIWAYSRVDTITDELAKKLIKAGIRWICLGIETDNSPSQENVNKQFTSEQLRKSITILKNNNINIIANYIFGLEYDDQKSMEHTLNSALKYDFDFANFYCAMAYPGSDLYNQAVENKTPLPLSWGGYSQHSYNCLPMATKYLSGPEVLRFRDDAFHNFFNSTKYLDHILNKFGATTRDHIIEMSKKRLKRECLEK